MNSIDARKFLEDQGFFTGNLWNVKDVTEFYKCSEEQAYYILEEALLSDYMEAQVWESIDEIARALKLEENQY